MFQGVGIGHQKKTNDMTLLWDLWYSHLSAQQTKTTGFAAYAQRWRWGCKNGNSTRSSSSKVVVIVQGFQKGVRQPTSRKPLRNRQSQNCLKDRRVPNMENGRGPLNRRIKIFHFAALEFWRQLISSPGLNLQDWLEHAFRNSQPASRASQPRTSHQAASQSARNSNTIWEWGTRSGLQKPWDWRTRPITALISISHQITLFAVHAFCKPFTFIDCQFAGDTTTTTTLDAMARSGDFQK